MAAKNIYSLSQIYLKVLLPTILSYADTYPSFKSAQSALNTRELSLQKTPRTFMLPLHYNLYLVCPTAPTPISTVNPALPDTHLSLTKGHTEKYPNHP